MFIGTFFLICKKSDNGLAGLNSTTVAEEKVDLKPKTLVSKNNEIFEENALISFLGLKGLSSNPGRF